MGESAFAFRTRWELARLPCLPHPLALALSFAGETMTCGEVVHQTTSKQCPVAEAVGVALSNFVPHHTSGVLLLLPVTPRLALVFTVQRFILCTRVGGCWSQARAVALRLMLCGLVLATNWPVQLTNRGLKCRANCC